MHQYSRKNFLLNLLGVPLMVNAGQVYAVLGQTPSIPWVTPTTNSSPAAKRLATAPMATPHLYMLHENILASGTVVQEYANPAGLVFAVAWQGPVLPDLGALLGDYFSTFKTHTDLARAIGKRGSPVTLESDKLVVRSSGRMRNFFGHAYAPDLIPVGVNIKNVFQ